MRYSYKVIAAPAKGRKAPGVKGAGARFAHHLEEVINEMAAQGWEYLRADILPSEERQGLTSSHVVYRSVLVFRRPVALAEATPEETAEATEGPDLPRHAPPAAESPKAAPAPAEAGAPPGAEAQPPLAPEPATPHLREVPRDKDDPPAAPSAESPPEGKTP